MINTLIRLITCPVAFLWLSVQESQLLAQDSVLHTNLKPTFSKSRVFIGTQVPLQLTAGYGYQLSNPISVSAQVGLITKPYSGFIVNAMEAFGLDRHLGRVIKKAFKKGVVLGVGSNYHFGKNYGGIYGQYMHLSGGGITPADALSVYFKKDFTEFDINGLPVFDFFMQSNLVNTGVLFGHHFQLSNPQLSLNGEISLSKIVASKNGFSSNRPLVDRTVFARNLYKEIDKEMRDAYWSHGFIPTVNLYLVYSFR